MNIVGEQGRWRKGEQEKTSTPAERGNREKREVGASKDCLDETASLSIVVLPRPILSLISTPSTIRSSTALFHGRTRSQTFSLLHPFILFLFTSYLGSREPFAFTPHSRLNGAEKNSDGVARVGIERNSVAAGHEGDKAWIW